MALALSPACYAFTAPAVPARAPAPVMETKADLEALAVQLNPAVGFWDPLKLSEANLWGQGEEATIGWIRESEIKHGLIAPEVWDAMPDIAKWQIIVFAGILETWRENKVVLEGEGQKHYMRGGKPGYFPTFDMLPHPVPFNLYDPWGVMTDKTEEQKAKGRFVEINNARLAMLGIMGFVSEAKIPG